MSTDTAKEDVYVFDSLVTQKLDMCGAENSSYRANEDGELPKAEQQGHSENLVDNTCAVKKTKDYTRYFIIKSLNHDNIQLSIQKGIWATQVMNEPILREAFNNSDKVILVFSVNMSGFFQGYAQMMSSVGCRRDSVWSQGIAGSKPWGRSFEVKWLQLSNLPFHKTLHLKNPLNDNKPVKISRDCQELPPDIGEALCELIDKEIDDGENVVRHDAHLRWHAMEPSFSPHDQGYDEHSITKNSGNGSMPYRSSFQQHIQASRCHRPYQGSVGVIHPGDLPFMKLGPAHSRYSLPSQKIPNAKCLQLSSQLDGWSLVGDVDPLYNSISEDEFLEMSYEEYLEAHSGSNKRGCDPAVAPLRGKQDSSNKEDDGDVSSRNDHKYSHKRNRR